MRKTRIAAAAAAVLLTISSVALANGSVESSTDTRTDVTASSPTIVDDSRPPASEPATTTVTAVSTSPPTSAPGATTSTPGSAPTSLPQGSTTTSLGDHTSTTIGGATSTTIDDSSRREDRRAVVSLELRTYTVGEAGTVTVEGMHLIAVDANGGWNAEIDEASADRIRVEFERGEVDAEFELRSDGELRIRTHD